MRGSMRKGHGPVAALLLQVFAALLLLCSGSAFAQTVTFTGASPSTFSAAGQTITFTITFGGSNAITHSLALNNMSVAPAPISALSCSPGFNIQPNNSTTCTFTYVTQSNDVALGNVDMFGSYTASPPSGSPTRSGSISNHQIVPYVAAGQAPVANNVSATVSYGSANNPITLNISGGAPTSVAVATAATHGTATASGTSITYTPVAGYAGADSFTYTATNASGTSSPATISITVLPPPAPTVTSISPTSGPTGGGTTVVITGTGFAAAPATGAVKFGATNATYTINSNTQITATSPANSAGTYDVTVTTPGGTSATGA
ncbi:MAG: IPT/TIG domain-containing protein, partial [Lysobacter sp.]|nr:IPT/TIG domain-containing protein [Lysobacter sp.]